MTSTAIPRERATDQSNCTDEKSSLQKNRSLAEILGYDPNTLGPCYEWTGEFDKQGRAITRNKNRVQTAARRLWTAFNGQPPAGMYVCHKCDNPKCVRLDHLFLGTPKENYWDAVYKGRIKPREWINKRREALFHFVNQIERASHRRHIIETCKPRNRMKRATLNALRQTANYAPTTTLIKWAIEKTHLTTKTREHEN